MINFIFCLGFTVVTAFLAAFVVEPSDQIPRIMLTVFAVISLFATWHAWKVWRRSSSLRVESESGIEVYVWIETDGRERRSTEDPRPDWDADGGDGDGGGD